MRLADLPIDVFAELTALRHRRGRGVHPDHGLAWFPRGCAVCGGDAEWDSLDTDHCHVTGLYRGSLCRGCNASEARTKHSVLWDFWRLNAPGFTKRYIEIDRQRSRLLTQDEVMTLPIADLLQLDADRRSELDPSECLREDVRFAYLNFKTDVFQSFMRKAARTSEWAANVAAQL